MMSSLIPSSSDEEEGVLQVRIPYGGSRQQHVDILLAGVPVRGVIDSGSDITIVGCETFQRVAAGARLRRKNLLKPDKVPRSYDGRTFTLNGRMDLDLTFDGVTMKTPVYIKMDAPEQLLLAEGVCRQLNIIYHPLVAGQKKTRKRKLCQQSNQSSPNDMVPVQDTSQDNPVTTRGALLQSETTAPDCLIESQDTTPPCDNPSSEDRPIGVTPPQPTHQLDTPATERVEEEQRKDSVWCPEVQRQERSVTHGPKGSFTTFRCWEGVK